MATTTRTLPTWRAQATILWYAHQDVTGWHTETIALDLGNEGGYPALRLDDEGHPRLSYWNAGVGAIEYARHDGSAWVTETVTTEELIAPQCTSLALDRNGFAHISYGSGAASRGVFHTYQTDTGWQRETVDDVASTCAKLALDSQGIPHIAYHDADGQDLKYARLLRVQHNIYLPVVARDQ